MEAKTVGQERGIGKTGLIRCVRNDPLTGAALEGDRFLLLLLRAGRAVFRSGDREIPADAPCVVCFDGRRQPVLVEKQALRCDSVDFHPAFFGGEGGSPRSFSVNRGESADGRELFLLRPFTDPENFVFPLCESRMDDMRALYDGLEWELSARRSGDLSCRSRSYLTEMLLRLERLYGLLLSRSPAAHGGMPGRIGDARVRRVLLYIETHYAKPVTLEELTRVLALNRTTLVGSFKKATGMTPIAYLWQYRVFVAKRQVESTDIPLRELALGCGFKTVQHFNRKFEEQVGIPPAVCRRRAAKGRAIAGEG